ncbi:polysaccharide deacetylase family protein [Nitrogeniibacter mangrovi]|uniref:Polysaccharide deacetylase family protein n=1 Tax=Nitrogeniibacter mangrovi TaxID=2016596 RepID=A0A6C1AYQ6_9RHOO|nr:polysaccharide deacetylase family protein [Nitrogeniibacter mangrovi]QID16467.1 polysaccharide deacetylase family protein [Nitrogeniibacter mangrovi]
MNSPRPWRPGALLWGSALLHVAALAGVALAPAAWPWALGAVILNHGLITAVGLWPRSTWLGPNRIRLPATAAARRQIAITIDDGPDPAVTPAVLDVLEAHGARATFFCIGTRARAHPALIAEIVRRGHELGNHSEHHRHHFSLLGPAALTREIGAAQATLHALGGRAPAFFRAPAGLRNPFLEPVLARLGLHLASWTRRGFDTRETNADTILARLTRHLAAGDILLLHDGHAARCAATGEPVILAVLPRLLARCDAAGLTPVTLSQAIG